MGSAGWAQHNDCLGMRFSQLHYTKDSRATEQVGIGSLLIVRKLCVGVFRILRWRALALLSGPQHDGCVVKERPSLRRKGSSQLSEVEPGGMVG